MADRRPVEERHYSGEFVFEPEPGYRTELFGQGGCSVTDADVLAMWEAEGALPADAARERLPEVLLAGVHEEKGLAGIATTYLREVEQIGMELWHTRIFIAREHRQGNLGLVLIERAVRTHRERYLSGADTRGAGMAFVVENKGLRERFNQAFWLQPEATFIGENADGYHVRVDYFPGATVPPPPGLSPSS
jgi:hypothetical protein